jgi:hypothetical protein
VAGPKILSEPSPTGSEKNRQNPQSRWLANWQRVDSKKSQHVLGFREHAQYSHLFSKGTRRVQNKNTLPAPVHVSDTIMTLPSCDFVAGYTFKSARQAIYVHK